MGLGSLRCPSEMEKPSNVHSTIDRRCLPRVRHGASRCELGSEQASPHDSLGSGGTQVQADGCFGGSVRVILGGKDT